MEEALVKVEVSFVADEEAREVAEMGKGALHFPASAVAAERASILQLDCALRFLVKLFKRGEDCVRCGLLDSIRHPAS